ncbi:MAG: adenylate/guanylate cyclase domain-containing protein [Bacteroidota bacterium]
MILQKLASSVKLKRINKIFVLLLIICFNLTIISCSKSSVKSVDNLKVKPNIIIHFYEDKNKTLTYKQISSEQFANKYRKSEKDVLFFGISDAAYWIKIRIENITKDNEWCLHLGYIQNSFIDVYDSTLKDTVPIYKTGFIRPISNRPIKPTPYAFPLKHDSLFTSVYYVKVVSNGNIIIPIDVIKENDVWTKESKNNLWYGIYFGIIIGLFLYNLFLFIGLHDRSYFYYICGLASSLTFFATMSGYMLEYILPQNPVFNEILIELALSLILMFGGLFAVSILRIKEFSKFLYISFIILIGLDACSIPIMFIINLRLIQEIQYVLLPIQVFITLISGIKSWQNKNISAGYYIIAWIGYMVGGLINIAMYNGILPFTEFTNHAPEVGSGIEAILLSLVLSKRYQIYKKEKEDAINKALDIQKEANETLEQKVTERTEQLKIEKKKSDELLLNILPEGVAEELKRTGHCQPKTFSLVTVMFTDFKDFSKISERVSAELLVSEINYCFSAFDNILQRYKVEKIKTVGDAYMCAAGLPILSYSHAIDVVNAGVEMRDFILKRKNEKQGKGEIAFDMRIGIHTGPVVAGIVGTEKFSYDIWGDTVNLASRMEQSCEPGNINISGSTYELVKDNFNCVYRGKVEAKNKGKVDMYFVESN